MRYGRLQSVKNGQWRNHHHLWYVSSLIVKSIIYSMLILNYYVKLCNAQVHDSLRKMSQSQTSLQHIKPILS